jgi:L-ascorbate metabolism protein UlaG (beta-lactamase superfamily)
MKNDAGNWAVSKNSVIHLGDTGYTPAFWQTGAAFDGEVLLALVPIGNAAPRRVLRPWHQVGGGP